MLRVAANASERTAASAVDGPPVSAQPKAADDHLVIDEHTWKDLEVFQARGAGRTIHDLLYRTKTAGGAKVLHRRMMRPSSSAHRIREVQESVRYIIAHRSSFDCLPSEVVAHGVSGYLDGGLPVVASMNPLVALVEAITIRLEWRFYMLITQGVLRTAKLIRGLRHVLDPSRFPSPVPGELGVLIGEMRDLVSRNAFEGMPVVESWDLPMRTIFTLDRGFRKQEEETLRRLLSLANQVDALVAMADATAALGMVIPEVVEGPAEVEAAELVNLFVAQPVPVSIHLDRQRSMLFLTGPNMAGKSTLLRSLGSALYLAHLGMGVPAARFRFTPCESLVTALNISDDIHGGVSFFRAEAIRMKAIVESMNAGRRVVALIDEPFKGTNVKDAMEASWLVLESFASATDCLFGVSSHLIELGDALLATDRVVCARFEAVERDYGLDFDYTLRAGVSTQRLGMRVLEQEGLVAQLQGRPRHRRLD